VLSDARISPTGAPDGVWNNAIRRSFAGEILQAALDEIPGNHDAAQRPDAIDTATRPIVVLHGHLHTAVTRRAGPRG